MLSFFGAACTIGASQQMFLQQGELEFEGHAEAVALQTVIAIRAALADGVEDSIR